MKNTYMKYTSVILFFLLAISAKSAAQVSSLYHLKTVANRHEMNPAFQPQSNIYVDIPILPTMSLGFGTNSLTFSDIVYPKKIDGKMQTITFLHPEGDKDKFYNKLKTNTRVFSEFSITLLGFGIRIDEISYANFSITQKANAGVIIPKDFFKLGLYGADSIPNTFNLKKLSAHASVYTEIALGYSREITEDITVGAKAKLLLGQANASLKADRLNLNTSREMWELDVDGSIDMSLPGAKYTLDEDGRFDDIDADFDGSAIFKPCGTGLAFDFGVTYKMLNDRLLLSASIIDLGFIKWKKNAANMPFDGSYSFGGVDFNKAEDSDDFFEEYFDVLKDSVYYTATFNSYRTGISSKIFAGAEYYVLKDKISIGLLSKSTILNKSVFQEITASGNYKPTARFNGSLSYSLINGKFSNLGLAVSGVLGVVNLYLAADYIPFQYIQYGIPHKTKSFNLDLGMIFVFGNKKKEKVEKIEVIEAIEEL